MSRETRPVQRTVGCTTLTMYSGSEENVYWLWIVIGRSTWIATGYSPGILYRVHFPYSLYITRIVSSEADA